MYCGDHEHYSFMTEAFGDFAHVNALLRMKSGGRGVLTVSQVATGEENALRLRVYASKGAIVWSQENPNYMELYRHGQPRD